MSGGTERKEDIQEMTLVIIESPYAGDIKTYEKYGRACMRDSLKRGEAPLASHLLYTQKGILDDNKPEERNQGIAAGFAWGSLAHKTVAYVDLGISEGMILGIKKALEEGKQVEFRRLESWTT